MVAEVDQVLRAGDSVGGIFEVVARGLPPGLGSHAQWDEKLDARLAQAVMSIQAVKAVELGSGVTNAGSFGSEVQDEIRYDTSQQAIRPLVEPRRRTRRRHHQRARRDRARIPEAHLHAAPRAAYRGHQHQGSGEGRLRASDVCVVPAGGVVGEAMVALVLAGAFLEKFGGDSLEETRRNFDGYQRQLDNF